MLSQTEHNLQRLKEIADEIAKSTEETLTSNPEWFEEFNKIYNENFKPKPKPKLRQEVKSDCWQLTYK